MPLLQIDLMEGHSAETHRRLLEECTARFARIVDSPIERFRSFINLVPTSQWALGGVVGDAKVSPLIRIDLMEGRPQQVREALISELSQLTADILGIPLADTRVYISEIPPDRWGIAGVPASQVRASEVAARAAAQQQQEQ